MPGARGETPLRIQSWKGSVTTGAASIHPVCAATSAMSASVVRGVIRSTEVDTKATCSFDPGGVEGAHGARHREDACAHEGTVVGHVVARHHGDRAAAGPATGGQAEDQASECRLRRGGRDIRVGVREGMAQHVQIACHRIVGDVR